MIVFACAYTVLLDFTPFVLSFGPVILSTSTFHQTKKVTDNIPRPILRQPMSACDTLVPAHTGKLCHHLIDHGLLLFLLYSHNKINQEPKKERFKVSPRTGLLQQLNLNTPLKESTHWSTQYIMPAMSFSWSYWKASTKEIKAIRGA
ncbi:hypothetical protein V6N11_074270 [Hibiscus sabdariffa]|uniref:Uncharacterized protein n=1 Tax=Hibiscus sabdariffa TaxID=183260 RepID=A0ABR1ZH42_9ROSI